MIHQSWGVNVPEYFINFVRIYVSIVIIGMLTACSLNIATPTPTPPPTATRLPTATPTPTPAQTPTPIPIPYPWTDASAVMRGICFESAYDAAGRTFVIRSADALARFFNAADNSRLCRLPVTRGEFDFSDGRILAGLWSRGMGCKAHHEVKTIRRDDAAQQFILTLTLVTEGSCNYELVRPFWIALDGMGDYDVQIVVEE